MATRVDSWPIGLAMFVWFWIAIMGGGWAAAQYVSGGWLALAVLFIVVSGYGLIWGAAWLIAPEWMRRLSNQDERDRLGGEAANIEEAYQELKAERKRLKAERRRRE